MSENEYKEWVLAYYDEKLNAGILPSELLLPTPANIKSEVLRICALGLSSKDEQILSSFIKQKGDAGNFYNAIRNNPADPFRPLVNLLKDRSIDTNQRNIDLLALILDFKPRPFHFTIVKPPKVTTPTVQATKTREPEEQIPKKKHPASPSRNPAYKLLLLILTLLVLTVGIFIIIRQREKRVATYGCMIWSYDHYEPVDCSDNSSGKSPSPVNWQLVKYFKRITKADTLTLNSVGKVWYAKYDGRVEFFTAPGVYPLDSNRRVLPMSVHILQKYVLHTVN